jgi:hypothetical protein
MSQRIRRLALTGDYADDDWTDPANPVPQNARRFKVLAPRLLFDVIARASTDTDAEEVDVGAMVIDAWVGYESRPRDPSDPTGPKTIKRGQSVVEATTKTLSTRIRLESTGTELGAAAVLNVTLTGVAVSAVDIELVDGGRLL